MSSSKTSNYQLNQWVKSDRVLMSEFNSDNAKIDAALAGKASASALSSLQSTVNGKADKSALDALKTTVTQHTASLAGKGNCQIYVGSYTGTGTAGSDHQNSFTFPDVPEIVFISAVTGIQATFIRGQTTGFSTNGSTGSTLTVSWSGKTLQWHHYSSDLSQMNVSGTTYLVVALMKAD